MGEIQQDAAAETAQQELLPPAGHEPAEIDPEDLEPPPLTPASRRRVLWAIAVLVTLGLAAVLPPLINVNRYQRRIASSISASLGRPVHLDSVTLNILPLPGFTLTNFVVSEDPSFGFEPVIRANSVLATLRLRSLWHHRVEFSKIQLDEPSVNLVRRVDGRWNIESILLQASRMPVLPTAQKDAGPVQRFPYIEATGARVNLKQGLEKKPISLTDAEFALWLPQPDRWRLRLEAHPTRTDSAATDAATVRIEGTLGKADALQNVPVDLQAEWRAVPLGAATTVLLGHDAGLRGEMTFHASISGTVGDNTSTARLELRRLRRADFVPAHPLDVDVSCAAQAHSIFHQFDGLKCLWPPDAEQSGLGGLLFAGDIPDVHDLSGASLQARFTGVQTTVLLDALRAASSSIAPSLISGGTVSGQWTCCGEGPALGSSGDLVWNHARLSLQGQTLQVDDESIPGDLAGALLSIAPFPLDLGGAQPAMLSLQADRAGMRMRLTGFAQRGTLLALAAELPQFGEGLRAVLPLPGKAPELPLKLDLVSTRTWGSAQVWSVVPHAIPSRHSRRR